MYHALFLIFSMCPSKWHWYVKKKKKLFVEHFNSTVLVCHWVEHKCMLCFKSCRWYMVLQKQVYKWSLQFLMLERKPPFQPSHSLFFFFSFLFKYLLVWKAEWQRGKFREMEIFCLLVDSLAKWLQRSRAGPGWGQGSRAHVGLPHVWRVCSFLHSQLYQAHSQEVAWHGAARAHACSHGTCGHCRH